VEKLDASLIGQTVLVRARVHNVRAKGKSAFMVLRQNTSTAQVTHPNLNPTGA
jgi:aspartyl/asparaginyl-tRNA synthetase